jgi:hypothetical protein
MDGQTDDNDDNDELWFGNNTKTNNNMKEGEIKRGNVELMRISAMHSVST